MPHAFRECVTFRDILQTLAAHGEVVHGREGRERRVTKARDAFPRRRRPMPLEETITLRRLEENRRFAVRDANLGRHVACGEQRVTRDQHRDVRGLRQDADGGCGRRLRRTSEDGETDKVQIAFAFLPTHRLDRGYVLIFRHPLGAERDDAVAPRGERLVPAFVPFRERFAQGTLHSLRGTL